MTLDGSAQDCFDTSFQFTGAERFDDVIVGAALEAHHAIRLVAVRGNHDDGGIEALPQLINVIRGEMSIIDPDGSSPSFLD